MVDKNLYPARKMCKTCRKKLDKVILAGQYCSFKCGGFPAPASNVMDAPRGCKRPVNGNGWEYKARYLYPEQVPEKWQQDATSNIYLCDNCRTWHIGHSRPEEYESLTRYVNSFEELGSVIKRHRETMKLDKKALAKNLKVPAIRITEIEDGSPKANIVVLFKVLEALKLKVSVMNLKVKK